MWKFACVCACACAFVCACRRTYGRACRCVVCTQPLLLLKNVTLCQSSSLLIHPLNSAVQNVLGKKYTDVGVGAGAGVLGGGGGGTTGAGSNTAATAGRHKTIPIFPLFLSSSHPPFLLSFSFPYSTIDFKTTRTK